jgi:hypothetical protein
MERLKTRRWKCKSDEEGRSEGGAKEARCSVDFEFKTPPFGKRSPMKK